MRPRKRSRDSRPNRPRTMHDQRPGHGHQGERRGVSGMLRTGRDDLQSPPLHVSSSGDLASRVIPKACWGHMFKAPTGRVTRQFQQWYRKAFYVHRVGQCRQP